MYVIFSGKIWWLSWEQKLQANVVQARFIPTARWDENVVRFLLPGHMPHGGAVSSWTPAAPPQLAEAESVDSDSDSTSEECLMGRSGRCPAQDDVQYDKHLAKYCLSGTAVD